NVTAPVPVFLGLNFYGNHTISADTFININQGWIRNNDDFGVVNNRATEKSRGVRVNRWPLQMIIDAGYGLATIYYGDLDPDKTNPIDWEDGIHPLFARQGQAEPDSNQFGAIGAWSWGLSRAVDYFETDDDIDNNHIALMGHSRLGKAALWAGAYDDRFSLVISNNSGCGGAALSRRQFGETIWRINNSFPHWFCKNFHTYNNNESALPVDQHMLLALIAPRPLYVASAEEDKWADPKGEFLSAFHASKVYELYGKRGLADDNMPAINQPLQDGSVAYHIRSGGHDVTDYDWEQYLKFASGQWGK
ncbi:MAG: acetylxylan esterase, partial [Cyclobacteriaceae bacterium]